MAVRQERVRGHKDKQKTAQRRCRQSHARCRIGMGCSQLGHPVASVYISKACVGAPPLDVRDMNYRPWQLLHRCNLLAGDQSSISPVIGIVLGMAELVEKLNAEDLGFFWIASA